MFPVFHAAWFDHVPVPAKYTGPKLLPPEFIVFTPVPIKYTFMDVVHVPCVLTMARLPYRFKLFAELVEAKFGLFVVTVHVIFLQSALGTFKVTVWLTAENDELLNTTSSMDVGGHSPPAPPLLNDHRLMSFQLPEPPTQYKVREAAAPPA